MATRQDTSIPTSEQSTVQKCLRCESEFTGRKRKYCTIECRQRTGFHCRTCGNPLGLKKKLYCDGPCRPRFRTCEKCGKGFVKKPGESAGRFCSRECWFDPLKQATAERRKEKQAARVRVCVVCGTAAMLVRCCSDECRRVYARRQSREHNKRTYKPRHTVIGIRQCDMCDAEFEVTGKRRYAKRCSRRCDAAFGRFNAAKSKRRRSRLMSDGRIPYKRIDIFDRDEWRCWLCGERCDVLSKVPQSLAPTIDHVTPLSKGGKDRPDNVKCACFGCNSKKTDTLIEVSMSDDAMTGMGVSIPPT